MIPSLDKPCARCGVPFPPVVFEHSGGHHDTCLPCFTRSTANRTAAWKRSKSGRRSYAITKRKRIEADSAAYADKVAAYMERRGAA